MKDKLCYMQTQFSTSQSSLETHSDFLVPPCRTWGCREGLESSWLDLALCLMRLAGAIIVAAHIAPRGSVSRLRGQICRLEPAPPGSTCGQSQGIEHRSRWRVIRLTRPTHRLHAGSLLHMKGKQQIFIMDPYSSLYPLGLLIVLTHIRRKSVCVCGVRASVKEKEESYLKRWIMKHTQKWKRQETYLSSRSFYVGSVIAAASCVCVWRGERKRCISAQEE